MMRKDCLMEYYISDKDKKDRANRLSDFLITFKRKLDDPKFRTEHNLRKWKHIKNKTNKALSSLGYKINLETEILRELIPMKKKDTEKVELSLSLDNLLMLKSKYESVKKEMLKAKEDYKNKLKMYREKK